MLTKYPSKKLENLPFNLLIFPLVGGYYVTTRAGESRYISQRLSSQAILFNAVLVAMPLLFISLTATTALTLWIPSHVNWIRENLFPVHQEFFGTCLLSLILAYTYTKFQNFRIRKDKDRDEAINSAITQIGNELELLFAYSCINSQIIQITLKNDKVYIGWVKVLPKPSQCPYIQLIPLLSGYRDDTKELNVTTDYSQVYSTMISKGQIKSLDDSDIHLVILVNEIISASKFSFTIFEGFMEARKKKQAQ